MRMSIGVGPVRVYHDTKSASRASDRVNAQLAKNAASSPPMSGTDKAAAWCAFFTVAGLAVAKGWVVPLLVCLFVPGAQLVILLAMIPFLLVYIAMFHGYMAYRRRSIAKFEAAAQQDA